MNNNEDMRLGDNMEYYNAVVADIESIERHICEVLLKYSDIEDLGTIIVQMAQEKVLDYMFRGNEALV